MTEPNEIPTFDYVGEFDELRDAFMAATVAVDRWIHARKAAGLGTETSHVRELVYCLEVSDSCRSCHHIAAPLRIEDNGRCTYDCYKCGNSWTTWWTRDREVLALLPGL